MLEDDVVCALGDILRSAHFLVLAEGANQGSFFRFEMHGRIKAPDLVALQDRYLIIGEGKVKGRDSFRRPKGRRHSDFECMAYLAATPCIQRKLAREATRRAKTFKPLVEASQLMIVPVIFAIGGLAPHAQLAAISGVTLVEVAVDAAKLGGVYGCSAPAIKRLMR
jgi:hypothetical protein